jgi:asparagine synthase (glutamine-hydrolysing)
MLNYLTETHTSQGGDKLTMEHIIHLCQQLDGEYAFIIYDTRDDKLFFSVDELRVRPLFLAKGEFNNSMFVCLASEQKALIPFESRILIVEPGTVYSTAPGLGLNISKHYNMMNITPNNDMNIILAAAKLRELIGDSMKRKLNPEREFCFLLSGGLDSSLACGIAAKLLSPVRIRTFTLGFDVNASDVVYARKVAKHINSIHRELIFTYSQGEAALSEVIRFNESWDQTTTRASTIMYLGVKEIKKLHPEMAVIFSGEMSDELFMGYMEWKLCSDPIASRNHVIKRLSQISQFDGLRADRMVSSHGCELRLIYFSREILDFTLHLNPELLMPGKNGGIEKYLLRFAFKGLDVIPEDVLWRTKHASLVNQVGKNTSKIEQVRRSHNPDLICDINSILIVHHRIKKICGIAKSLIYMDMIQH